MPNRDNPIEGTKIKQVFLIIIITALVLLICWNLAMFIPSLLGAVTLYVVSRNYNFKLQEEKNWKPARSAIFIVLVWILVLVVPIYFIGDLLVGKLGDSKQYMGQLNAFIEKVQQFVYSKVKIDPFSPKNLAKVQEKASTVVTGFLSGTLNTLSIVSSMFFILYFMLASPRTFERLVNSAMPLKRGNINLIGEKFRKLVIANAVGLPVVALGQGIVAVVGYLIFGAPSPLLLFVLTALASMIPIVGAALVYIPVGIFMIASGDDFGGIGVLLWSLIIVGLTDNVLRFTLLKKLENIHPLNTVFGIIMGMNLFGFMGLIFGPIMVSITVLLIQVYKDEFTGDEERELIMPESKEIEQKIDLII